MLTRCCDARYANNFCGNHTEIAKKKKKCFMYQFTPQIGVYEQIDTFLNSSCFCSSVRADWVFHVQYWSSTNACQVATRFTMPSSTRPELSVYSEAEKYHKSSTFYATRGLQLHCTYSDVPYNNTSSELHSQNIAVKDATQHVRSFLLSQILNTH